MIPFNQPTRWDRLKFRFRKLFFPRRGIVERTFTQPPEYEEDLKEKGTLISISEAMAFVNASCEQAILEAQHKNLQIVDACVVYFIDSTTFVAEGVEIPEKFKRKWGKKGCLSVTFKGRPI